MKNNRPKSTDEKEQDDYGIDLKRFTNHKKVFPWMFIIKAILGLAMIAAAYYFSKELIHKQEQETKKPHQEIEVEIQEN